MIRSCKHYLLTLLCYLLLAACLKKEYTPLAGSLSADTVLPVYKTIAELKVMMGSSGTMAISSPVVISGVVTADDRSGNFYKQVIIDDGTAALPVLLDAYNLYSDYPVGRKLTIYCKGLYTSFYYKLPQLGYIPDDHGMLSPVPAALFGHFIRKGSYSNNVQPIPVMAADAAKAQPELLNRLITINDVQLSDTLLPSYALPATLSSATNMRIMDCDSHVITIRTSGYASFRALPVPKGRGSLTAIYTVYNNTPQLILRDTSDVHLYNTRCP